MRERLDRWLNWLLEAALLVFGIAAIVAVVVLAGIGIVWLAIHA